MFGFQSQNLVIGFLRKSLTLVGDVVQIFYFFNSLPNFYCQALVNTGLIALLLTPDINFLSKVLVLWLQVVKKDVWFVKLVLELLNLVLIFLHLRSGWSNGVKVHLFLIKFFEGLFVLVFKHQKSPKFK